MADEKTVKVKFTTNTCYKGVDYGPDCKEDTVVVDEHFAAEMIHHGYAVEVTAKKTAPGVVENRDPK